MISLQNYRLFLQEIRHLADERWWVAAQRLIEFGILAACAWAMAGLLWSFSLPEATGPHWHLPETLSAAEKIGGQDWFSASSANSANQHTADAPPDDSPRLIGVLHASNPENARALFAPLDGGAVAVIAPGATLGGETLVSVEPRAVVLRSNRGERRQSLAPGTVRPEALSPQKRTGQPASQPVNATSPPDM